MDFRKNIPPSKITLYIGLLKNFRKIFLPHKNSIAPPVENQELVENLSTLERENYATMLSERLLAI